MTQPAAPRLLANLLANLAGTGVLAASQFIGVPVFVGLLGPEAYGLIGFYATLQLSLQVLDLGLSATLNREMARRSSQPTGEAATLRNLLRTLEVAYWSIGLVLGLLVFLASDWIATHWLQSSSLPPGTVRRSVQIMGLCLAVQWPAALYLGGLMGLQRQVVANVVRMAYYAAATAGGIVLVLLWWRSVEVVFWCQFAAAAAQTVAMGYILWRGLPVSGTRTRVEWRLLRDIRHFAGGISGIALGGMILTQMDKVLLSRLLPLDLFGYYAAAALLANGLRLFISPIYSALFPRMSSLVARHDSDAIRQSYHAGSQLMSVLVLPLAAVLVLFAPEVLLAWTGDARLVPASTDALRLLVAGTAINGLMYMPYALQLAHGWTRLSLVVTAGMCVAMVPGIVVLTRLYGPAGAASVWLALNLLNLLISLPLTHRRLLPGEASRWLAGDVAAPGLTAVAVVGLCAWLMPGELGRWSLAIYVAIAFGLAVLAASLAASELRPRIRALARRGVTP